MTPMTHKGEKQAFVVVRRSTEAPLATIWAPNHGDAAWLAYTMYGEALALSREAFPRKWEQAFDRECRAEHAARTESIWQALVKKFTR